MSIWVYDLEVLGNFFSGTFLNPTTNEVKVYVIHHTRDDRKELLAFLNDKSLVKGLIGFNNLNYDYPMLHYLLTYKKIETVDVNKLVSDIYNKSQEIIDTKGNSSIRKPLIKQLDLYKLNHYDGAQKRCSLKHLEFSFRWHNLQDMPIKHYESIHTKEEVDSILSYNYNDVAFTAEFYSKCSNKIEQRKDMKQLYGIDFTNTSDTSIGTQVIAKLYSKKTGRDYYDYKEARDTTEKLCLGDIVWDKIEFKSKELQDLLYHIKNTTINLKTNKVISTTYAPIWEQTGDDKDKFKISIKLNNTTYDVLLGGLHSTMPPGITKESKTYKIKDLDFGSFYPGIMLMLKIFPPQLGEEMLAILRELTNLRLVAKRDKNKILSNALKLLINSVFGNLGNEYSFLYSPTCKNKVTINGQLMLLMLIEKLEEVDGIECFYGNTDGATFKVDNDKLELFEQIAEEYSLFVDIPVEFADYEECYIRDVNNYLIITKELDKNGKPKVKVKGDFERTEDGKEWHKNHSMNIVSKALWEYYVNGTNVEEYIRNHDDIYDFLIMVKSIGSNKLELHSYQNFELVKEPLQKINRYYISSNSNKTLMKVLPPLEKLTDTDKHRLKVNPNQSNLFDFVEDVRVDPDRESNVEAGYKVTILNEYVKKEINEYEINYDYYINECYKIINAIK